MKIKLILCMLLLTTFLQCTYAAVYTDGKVSVNNDLSEEKGEKTIVIFPESKKGKKLTANDILYIDQDDSDFRDLNVGNVGEGAYSVNLAAADMPTVSETLVRYGTANDVSGVRLSCSEKFYVFEQGDNASFKLSWTNKSTAKKSINIRVADYFGKSVYLSSFVAESGESLYEIDIPDLECGAFELDVSFCETEYSAHFAVVPQLAERNASEDNIAALSTMAYCTNIEGLADSEIEEYVRTVALAGVKHVREAAIVRIINPSQGVYTYPQKLELLLEAYKKYGIKTVLMFQEMPKYMLNADDYLPEDMQLVYDAFHEIINHYRDLISEVEIYNEPENPQFSRDTEGADKYAAFAKAVSAAAADAGIKTTNAGLIGINGYRDVMLKNLVTEYTSSYNEHRYIKNYDDRAFSTYADNSLGVGFIEEAKKYGKKDIVLTETGTAITHRDGETELDDSQQRNQARTAVAAFVDGAERGFARLYWFKHGYYYENNGISFSTMSKKREPYYIYSALSAFENAVGNGKYIGKISGLDDDVLNGYFADGGRYIGCFMSQNDGSVTVETGTENAVVINMMGNAETVAAENGRITLKVGADPIYLVTDRLPGNVERVADDTGNSDETVINEAERVVMLAKFESYNGGIFRTGDANQLATNGANKLKLNIFNLNDREIGGIVVPKAFGGWICEEGNREITVPPRGTVTLDYTVTPGELIANDFVSPLVFDFKTVGGDFSTCMTPIRAVPSFERAHRIEGSESPAGWHDKSGENVKYGVNIDETTIRFDYSFSDTSNMYNYPYIKIPESIDFGKTGGIMFRCKADKPIENMLIGIFITQNGKRYAYLKQHINLTEEWKTMYFDWKYVSSYDGSTDEAFDPSKADRNSLRIGFSNYSTENVFSFYMQSVSFYDKAELTQTDIKNIGYEGGRLTLETEAADMSLKEADVFADIDGERVFGTAKDGTAIFSLPLEGGRHMLKFRAYDEGNGILSAEREFYADGFGIKADNPQFLPSEGNLKIDMLIHNYGSGEKNICVYAASYDKKGRLTEVLRKNCSVQGKNAFEYEENIGGEYENVRLFVWEDTMPLGKPHDYEKKT